jgi:DNA-binding SARP family transcriptional activator
MFDFARPGADSHSTPEPFAQPPLDGGPGGLRLRVLGSLEASRDGVDVDLGPAKQRAVLGLLLLRANRVVSLSEFSDALWGDSPPRTARKNIQVYMSALRGILMSDPDEVVAQGTDSRTRQHPQSGRPAYRQPASHDARLRPSDAPGIALLRRPPGYELRIDADRLDALRFQELVRAGRRAADGGDTGSASALLGHAIRLWRGPVLPDLAEDAPVFAAEAAALRERYLSAFEDWAEAELALGRQAELLDALEEVTRAHPMRERLRHAEMTALYRCGRRPEALARFDAMRQLLARDLGLRPSPVLARLYAAILADDPRGVDSGAAASARSDIRAGPAVPAPAASGRGANADSGAKGAIAMSAVPAPAVSGRGADTGTDAKGATATPAGLAPALAGRDATAGPGARGAISASAGLAGLGRDLIDFTGRRAAVDQLIRLFTGTRRGVTAVISGPAGIGKTALAVHCAHLLAEPFPDGRVLIRLRGADAGPRATAEVLADLLSAGGAESLAAASAHVVPTSNHRMLIILDDAVAAEQVRSLISVVGDRAVLVTARHRLDAVEAAAHLALEPLAAAEAIGLLRRALGADRCDADPDGVSRLIQACAGSPLALRIAAARLAGLAHVTPGRFADRLADERRTLDELVIGDLDLRSRLAGSCADLPPDELAALRLLARAGAPAAAAGFTVEEAAEALGTDAMHAEWVLERLMYAHCVEVREPEVLAHSGQSPVRFALSALMHVFARELDRS